MTKKLTKEDYYSFLLQQRHAQTVTEMSIEQIEVSIAWLEKKIGWKDLKKFEDKQNQLTE